MTIQIDLVSAILPSVTAWLEPRTPAGFDDVFRASGLNASAYEAAVKQRELDIEGGWFAPCSDISKSSTSKTTLQSSSMEHEDGD